jgi:hypothetical protein
MDEKQKRLDLNSETGMTRRDLMRRGAIVGGTLLWAAPAIQSLSTKAYAQEVGRSGECATCYCSFRRHNGTGQLVRDECNIDGVNGIYESDATCAAFCAAGGNRHPTGGYNGHQYTRCTTDCRCSSKTAGNSPPFGVSCPP